MTTQITAHFVDLLSGQVGRFHTLTIPYLLFAMQAGNALLCTEQQGMLIPMCGRYTVRRVSLIYSEFNAVPMPQFDEFS